MLIELEQGRQQLEYLKLTSKDLMVDWCSAICFPCIRTRLSDSVPIFSLWARTSSISVIKPLIFKCNWAFSRCKTLTLCESCVPSDCIFCIVVSRSFRKFATWLNQIQVTAWEYIPYDTALDMAGFFFPKSTDIFFLFHSENICCGYSLEAPQRGASNEYPHIFSQWNKKYIYLMLLSRAM